MGSQQQRQALFWRLANGAVGVGALAGCLTFAAGSASATTGARPNATVRAGSAFTAAPASTPAQDVQAFYDAGYTYRDALDLAALWASPTVYNAKVRAGARLLAGKNLPKIPKTFTSQQDINAFYASGYDYLEALQLAAIWDSPTGTAAKARAGADLLAGRDLPKIPKAFTQQQDVHVFYITGGDYQEALQLAAVWASPTVYRAKARAGGKFLAGAPLPIPKTFTPRQDVNAFLASGYTYADAVQLAKLWHSASPYAAKVRGGTKLLAGQTLPIRP